MKASTFTGCVLAAVGVCALGVVQWCVLVIIKYKLQQPYLPELLQAASWVTRDAVLAQLAQVCVLSAICCGLVFVVVTKSVFRGNHAPSQVRRGAKVGDAHLLKKRTDMRRLDVRVRRAVQGGSFDGARWRNVLRAVVAKPATQISIAKVPIPLEIEPLHFLIAGSTGSGKSQAIKEMLTGVCARDERLVVIDPNGDYYSIFGRPEDQILNPFDARSPGWSVFNEIRNEFDCERFARSIVPDGTGEAKQWNGYAQFLIKETMKKLYNQGCRESSYLTRFVCDMTSDLLEEFLSDTAAAGMFAEGADRALGSTRFTATRNLGPHKLCLPGGFSLRDWLESGKGSLYITWREDMADALRPLITTWFDILITATLSMQIEAKPKSLWFVCDELASLEQLSSLEAGLTKGRKHGARFVCGIQSTAQLEDIYGREKAVILRSCFRNLLCLNVPHTDAQTAEDFSKGIGDVEVSHVEVSRALGGAGMRQKTLTWRRSTERLVMAGEIQSLPDLKGFLSLAGGSPLAKVDLGRKNYARKLVPYVARSA